MEGLKTAMNLMYFSDKWKAKSMNFLDEFLLR